MYGSQSAAARARMFEKGLARVQFSSGPASGSTYGGDA